MFLLPILLNADWFEKMYFKIRLTLKQKKKDNVEVLIVRTLIALHINNCAQTRATYSKFVYD